jgi:hypothetical protein
MLEQAVQKGPFSMQRKKESYRDSKQYKGKPYRDSYCLSFNMIMNTSKSNLTHTLLLSSWTLHHRARQMGTKAFVEPAALIFRDVLFLYRAFQNVLQDYQNLL